MFVILGEDPDSVVRKNDRRNSGGTLRQKETKREKREKDKREREREKKKENVRKGEKK